MKPVPFLAFLALGLATLFSGCSSTARPDGINVSVADLKAANSTVFETQLILTLRYTSESLNAFGFSGSSHKLYLNGSYVGKAVSNTPIGLPPLSTTTQDVTLILENAALVRQLIALQNEPVVRYRLESVLFTTAGEDDMKIKGTTEGTIDLRGLQGIHGG
ncbi:MAG: hypothetical protein JSR48_11750 [Verrucomicrobia bacterium]|nr:hypothetical protein [Verrucomicrobiota bacterium]